MFMPENGRKKTRELYLPFAVSSFLVKLSISRSLFSSTYLFFYENTKMNLRFAVNTILSLSIICKQYKKLLD